MSLTKKTIMLSFIVSLFIAIGFAPGCKTKHTIVSADAKPLITIVDSKPIIVPDTVKHEAKADKFKEEVKPLVTLQSSNKVTWDQLFSLNIEWQKRYMRLADTARNRYSLITLLRNMQSRNDLRDSIRDAKQDRSDKAAEQFYIDYRTNIKNTQSIKNTEKGSNILFWFGLVFYIFSVCAILYVLTKYRRYIERYDLLHASNT